ncbi:MAG: iron-sulfur cluster assembly accessory protein, partial [Gammaproteobacteria bacterium]|nr:iron-sulfur cluster assembly accessory protein [Gammaproteobacteria bacterium]
MAITLSEKAARHVQGTLAKRGKGIGLRVGVRTSGCSGLAYTLEFADEARTDDQRFESHGVLVLVDAQSLAYLDGTELDFVR